MTVVDDYLARLDVALRDVPHGIAADIRAGVAEELHSLDAGVAAARIAQLGDPEVIAREAVDASGRTPPATLAPAVTQATVSTTRTRGFAITATLALSFGGFLLPFVGWVVGAVMVGLSGIWRTWEKVVAISTPLVLFALLLLFALPAYTVSGSVHVQETSGIGTAPDIANPLVPTVYDYGHSIVIVLVVAVVPASGLWLLWRMRGRTAS